MTELEQKFVPVPAPVYQRRQGKATDTPLKKSPSRTVSSHQRKTELGESETLPGKSDPETVSESSDLEMKAERDEEELTL